MKNNYYDKIEEVMHTKSFKKSFNKAFSNMDDNKYHIFSENTNDKIKLAINLFKNHEKEFGNYNKANKEDICFLIVLYLLDLIDLYFITDFFNKLGSPYETLYEDLLAAKKK